MTTRPLARSPRDSACAKSPTAVSDAADDDDATSGAVAPRFRLREIADNGSDAPDEDATAGAVAPCTIRDGFPFHAGEPAWLASAEPA